MLGTRLALQGRAKLDYADKNDGNIVRPSLKIRRLS